MKIDNNMLEYLNNCKFDAGRVFDWRGAQHYNDRIEAVLHVIEKKRVVHLGATDHINLIEEKRKNHTWLHEQICENAHKVIGFDINEAAVNYVSRIGIDNIYCCDLLSQSIQARELLGDEQWDYMVAGEILEHIDNPVSFLKDINTLYKDRIHSILITVPNAFRLANVKNSLLGVEKINTDHKYWFTPYTLLKVAVRAGLIPEELIFTGFQKKGKQAFLLNRFKKNICSKDLLLIARLG